MEEHVLNRQKLILELLQVAGRPVAKLDLMKFAFLIARESPNHGGSAFYEFVPYHYGPYSFCLQRDLDAFVGVGLVSDMGNSWQLNACPLPPASTPAMQKDVRAIFQRFRNHTTAQIIDYVYNSYPEFTVNSKHRRISPRAVADLAIYTSGYEGLQVDGFLNRLVQVGIRRLVDVRNNPIARRYGFHKSTLQRLCSYLNIEYIHCPELGIVSEVRKVIVSEVDRIQLFQTYEHITLSQQTESVREVARLVMDDPSVLVCMEAEARRCHRNCLAQAIATITGLDIVHLELQT